MRTLLLLLLAAPILAQEVHYYVGERGNVLEAMKPGLTRELITKAAAAGCDGIVGLDQWSKNGDPRIDTRWRDSMHVWARLCESLSLELRPQVWNGSKHAYGFPDGIETYAPIGKSRTFLRAFWMQPGQRKFIYFDLPDEFARRLFTMEVYVWGGPTRLRFLRDTPGQEIVSKGVYRPGQHTLTFHSLENSTGWIIYIAPDSTIPTRVFVRGLAEREPNSVESKTYNGAVASYTYIGEDGKTGFLVGKTMNPDCTEAFYRVAMRQSLLFWQEFQDEPAIKGVWFSLDEVSLLGQHQYRTAPNGGEAFSQMVTNAVWFNYALWGTEAWGWNDCLGGHNSKVYTRASFGMENDGPPADTPFLGFAWNEGNATSLRPELARFDTGTVGAAVYLGTNNIDSAAAAIRDYECPQVLLFNWEYQKWVDSLAWIVPKIKGL